MIKTVLCLLAFLAITSSAQASMLNLKVFVPEVGKKVRVKVDVGSGQYRLYAKDFYRPQLIVNPRGPLAADCERVKETIEYFRVKDELQSSLLPNLLLVKRKAVVEFRPFMSFKSDSINEKVQSALSKKGYKNLDIANVSHFLIKDVELKFEWLNSSFSIQNNSVYSSVESRLYDLIKNQKGASGEQGQSDIETISGAMLCDLIDNKLAIEFGGTAVSTYALDAEKSKQMFTESHLVEINKEILRASKQSSNMDSLNRDLKLYVAGALSSKAIAETTQQSFLNFKPLQVMSFLKANFNYRTMQPKVITEQDIRNVVKSIRTTDFDRDYTDSEKIKTKVIQVKEI